MTIKYDSIAYSACVKNGKVVFEKEYYIKAYPFNKIVYIEKITQKQYNDYINEINHKWIHKDTLCLSVCYLLISGTY